MTVEKNFIQNYLKDNSIALSSVLIKEYNLNNLESYFGKIPLHEQNYYEGKSNRLTFYDVNKNFPVECVRQVRKSNYYSVYKVAEGGYYYVFWNLYLPSAITESSTYVTNTAYVHSLNKESDFNFLKDGLSTAQDVSNIASSFELSFTMSSGIYSFSLLNDGNVMEILYEYTDRIHSRDDLVQKNKKISSKEIAASASYLATIMNQDLPIVE